MQTVMQTSLMVFFRLLSNIIIIYTYIYIRNEMIMLSSLVMRLPQYLNMGKPV